MVSIVAKAANLLQMHIDTYIANYIRKGVGNPTLHVAVCNIAVVLTVVCNLATLTLVYRCILIDCRLL